MTNEITYNGPPLFKEREVETITMQIPEHLRDNIVRLIIQDSADFQTEEGIYKKWRRTNH